MPQKIYRICSDIRRGFLPSKTILDLDVSYKKVCFYQFTFIYIIALSNNKNGNVYFIYRDEGQITVDFPPCRPPEIERLKK